MSDLRAKGKRSNRRQRAIRAAAVLGAAVSCGSAAHAQNTRTWNNFVGTNNFNVDANWLEGTRPVSGATTVLNFGGTGGDSYTAVQNIANPFILNGINITSDATGPVIIG